MCCSVICGNQIFDDQLRRRKGLPPRLVEAAHVRSSRLETRVAVQHDVIAVEPEARSEISQQATGRLPGQFVGLDLRLSRGGEVFASPASAPPSAAAACWPAGSLDSGSCGGVAPAHR